MLKRWTCEHQVAGSTPGCGIAARSDHGQVVHTRMPGAYDDFTAL